MSSDIDPDHIGFLVSDIARNFRAAFEREITESSIGVTTSEARVLGQVARCGALRQAVLAERMGLAPMSLSVFLDRLECAGLVVRDTDPQDRRAKIVRLSPTARPILDQIAQIGARIKERALTGIAPEDQARFSDIARAIRCNLDTGRATADPAGADPAGPDGGDA